MAESWIKIRATANEMNKNFYNQDLSEFYFIKYFKGKNYDGKDDVPIVFETMIRHNEIGNRTIERSSPYTFETLEKTLAEKVKEYEQEQIIVKENEEYLDI